MPETPREKQIEYLAQNIIDNMTNNQHIEPIYRDTIITICKGIIDLSQTNIVDIIKFTDDDRGAIILLREEPSKERIDELKGHLSHYFPSKQFIILYGKDVEIIKI